MGKKEESLRSKILLRHTEAGRGFIFRNTRGKGWVGKSGKPYSVGGQRVMPLSNFRRVHFGFVDGASDMIGVVKRRIMKEDVGKIFSIFLAVELKSGDDTATREQKMFINAVRAHGGLAGIAYDMEDYEAICETPLPDDLRI